MSTTHAQLTMLDADPLSGTPYRTLRAIAAGPSSVVYEAATASGVQVAVKVMNALRVHSEEARTRFTREALVLARLEHESIVPILDAGTTVGDLPFLVMPFLRGETLRARLTREGRIAPIASAEILIPVLAALEAVHRAGLVHRDVKPANVLLTPRGPILLDFGIAAPLENDGWLTGGVNVIGTPRYFSPEQVLGGAVDGRADVYAAGLVLFEMLAGRTPFEGDGPRAQMRARIDAPAPPVRHFALVPAELDAAVACALDQRPSMRWRSAARFGLALSKVRGRLLRATVPAPARAVSAA